jgi:kinesin family protein 18/19
MMGNSRCDDAKLNCDAGIIPNALTDVFDLLNEKKRSLNFGESYSVLVSFIEVYNEQVYDLLEPTGRVLQLREDQERGVVVVAGVTERLVESVEEILYLLSEGNGNRKTEATMANQVSSRSHAVLQVTLRHTQKSESGKQSLKESKLSLIDLAGSERASATNNRGVRLQEGASINKSLLALANCINSLASGNTTGKKTNVKYRDSKLTHLLKCSLEGNCNLIMIANINPSHQTYEDSHNTLKYSNRAKNIKVNPFVVEQSKESNWLERENNLREENAFLRARVQELENQIKYLLNQKTESLRETEKLSNNCEINNQVFRNEEIYENWYFKSF